MNLIVHPGARADYVSGIAHLKARGRARGAAFAMEFRKAVAEISEFPRSYAADRRGVRKRQLGKFPYLVFYRILDEDIIEIVAVAHTSRDEYWRDRGTAV